MQAAPIPFRRALAAFFVLGFVGLAQAQTTSAAPRPARDASAGMGVNDWLMRMHKASSLRSYVGTFVVTSSNGGMSSARIWHACEGDVQVERVDALTGPARSTFRRNDEVVTFISERHVVRSERREALGLFPTLIKSADSSIEDLYSAQRLGSDRVAGFEADVVALNPRDGLRYGYRVWSERRTGLVVKLQTLDAEGRVLEQSAFSELALDAPVRADKLSQMMAATEGWRIEKPDVIRTTALSEGWQLHDAVAGFRPIDCYKRPGSGDGILQWIFSDGLAAVSVFVEPYDAHRHRQEGTFSSGATNTLTKRTQEWWVTAVGEVPPQTLRAFAGGLERRR